ncbi:hypothetical protein MIDIC_410028 [Alphaproteobacteria bacterium]
MKVMKMVYDHTPTSVKFGVGVAGVATAYAASSVFPVGLAAKILAPTCLPYINQKLTDIAVEGNNAGLLDFSLQLNQFLSSIPLVGKYLSTDFSVKGVELLHKAIDGGQTKIVDVLAQKVNVNAEYNNVRPLDLALKSTKLGADVITKTLIDNNADLSNGKGQNFFQDVVHTGKKELVEAAYKNVATNGKQDLVNSADKDGNTLPILTAVSPELRDLVAKQGAGVQSTAFNVHNAQGKTSLDAIVYAYDAGKATAGDVGQYLDKGAVETASKDFLFPKSLHDANLRGAGIPEKLLAKDVIEPAKSIRGDLPVDFAIKYGSDALAKGVAEKMPSVLTDRHVAKAHIAHKLGTLEYTQQRVIGGDASKLKHFLNNPFEDGDSLLGKMILDVEHFDPVLFKNTCAQYEGINPLEAKMVGGIGLLNMARIAKNDAAVETILQIASEGGIKANMAVLTGDGNTVMPALMRDGYGPELKQLLPANMNKDDISDLKGLLKQASREFVQEKELKSAIKGNFKAMKLAIKGGGSPVEAKKLFAIENGDADVQIHEVKEEKMMGEGKVGDEGEPIIQKLPEEQKRVGGDNMQIVRKEGAEHGERQIAIKRLNSKESFETKMKKLEDEALGIRKVGEEIENKRQAMIKAELEQKEGAEKYPDEIKVKPMVQIAPEPVNVKVASLGFFGVNFVENRGALKYLFDTGKHLFDLGSKYLTGSSSSASQTKLSNSTGLGNDTAQVKVV